MQKTFQKFSNQDNVIKKKPWCNRAMEENKSPEIDLYLYFQLISDNIANIIQQRKEVLSTTGGGTTEYPIEKVGQGNEPQGLLQTLHKS